MVFCGDFLEGFSVTSHEKDASGPVVKRIKEHYEGHPPVLRIKVVMSKVVFSGFLRNDIGGGGGGVGQSAKLHNLESRIRTILSAFFTRFEKKYRTSTSKNVNGVFFKGGGLEYRKPSPPQRFPKPSPIPTPHSTLSQPLPSASPTSPFP